MDTVKAAISATANGHHDGAPKDGFSPLVDECETPLRIAIVGAGIGGLSAAIGLRRNGHKIELYEQSRFANEIGAAVNITPNSNGILRRWGIYAEEFGANPIYHMIEYAKDGRVMKNIDLREANKRWQHPWLLVHRANLHSHLKKLATSVEGEGAPANLHTASKVVEIDPDKGTLTLENGETITADVIVGADGVYSRTRKFIQAAEPLSTGKAAFRFLIPRSVLAGDPVTQSLVADDGTLRAWYSEDRRIIMYPCNNNELLNFGFIHPDTMSHATVSDRWDKQASIEQVLKVYDDFDPVVKALIGKVESASIKVWQLLDMERLETWTKGKLVLLGDAAHPFTPYQGQGAGQALEDAAALTVVLPQGTAPEAIAERLKLYEEIRYERAHTIQDNSRKAGQDIGEEKPMIDMMKFANYNFGHDEIDHASNIFKRWKWAKKPDMYWRMPIVFGPFPGPRMDAYGRRRLADGPTRRFTTTSIKFKTSRTFLETILPNAQFSFKSADTVAIASLSVTRLEKLAWLSGQGYTHFGLYVHGVQYTKKDGTIINGTYLPVLFESLADPIVSGREELGMPKLFCDIEMHNRSKSCRVSASWRGATFAELALRDLKEDDPATEHSGTDGGGEEADSGTLVYRYIPAVGEPGKADAEYACLVPHGEEGEGQKSTVTKVWRAEPGKVSVDIKGLDWDALPTLHHVTEVLARIPVYEVLGAKVVEGTGVPDVMGCKRIE